MKATVPDRVDICECWPRDGLQGRPDVVATADKVATIEASAAAGVREVDATSLVPPRYAPQFADAEQVLAAIAPLGLRTRVLTPNLRGVQRAVEINDRTGAVTTIGFPISVSEAHNRANLRRTHAEQLHEIDAMMQTARAAGLNAVAAVATAFGCPIAGTVAEDDVFAMAGRVADLGVDRIMLSDTTGLADPVRAARYTGRAVEQYPHVRWIAHFHDTRGAGVANTWAAVLAGADCVDACLGGIGGEPSSVEQNHAGETGNVSTEDVVVLLERAGVRTGVDAERIVAAGRLAERAQGTPGRSQVQRSGIALDKGREMG